MKKFFAITLVLLIIIGTGVFIYIYMGKQPPPVTKPMVPGVAPALPVWCEIYFSQVYSGNPAIARRNPQNIDKMLVQKLNAALRGIDAALHELDSEFIAGALVDAHKRGVEVRVVTETDYMGEKSIEKLQHAGILVIDDMGRNGLMHNKFIVVDSRYLWTGSFNTTDNGAYKNNNNAIFIDSPKIAENFTAEFEEMFTQKKFGGSSPTRIPNPVVEMTDGAKIKTLFSPEDNPDNAIIAELNKARESISFMAFSFTHRGIGQAMIDRYQAGVDVRGVFETRGSDTAFSRYPNMRGIGIPVKQDGNRWFLHHKVIIIDGKTVITGSFNFSNNAANNNEENVLILSGNRAIAQAYIGEFERVYSEGTSVPPTSPPVIPTAIRAISARVSTNKINLNTASLKELTNLKGIGEKTANQIIQNRPYSKPEELLKVKGIGPKTFNKIEQYVGVE